MLQEVVAKDRRFVSQANPSQLEAIEATEGPVLIIAGPGSGKTFTLVERIVDQQLSNKRRNTMLTDASPIAV